MSRDARRQVDPEQAARLLAARDAEDAALALVNAHAAALDRARARRAAAIAKYDAEVEHAESELAEATGALAGAAGVHRAALVLGVTPAALRRVIPPAKPATPARVRPEPVTGSTGVTPRAAQ